MSTTLFCLGLVVTHQGAEKPKEPAQAVEAEEVVEVVDMDVDVDVDDEYEHAAPGGLVEILGRLHAPLVHLPIGWLLLLALVDALGLLGRRPVFANVGLPLAVLAALSFIPAVTTGLVNLSTSGDDADVLAPILAHRNFMLPAFFCTAIAASLRYFKRASFKDTALYLYLGFVAVACALTSYGGHLGGKLVFGDDYLPF